MQVSRRGSRRGQGLVEFALVMPLFLSLIFAMVDFSYYIFGWTTIQSAARRGAEQASIMPPRMIQSSYTSADVTSDPCLQAIYTATREGTSLISPTDDEVSFAWFDVASTSMSPMSGLPKGQDSLVLPRAMVEISVRHQVEPLTPLSNWVFDGPFVFDGHSRRTVLNIDVNPYNGC